MDIFLYYPSHSIDQITTYRKLQTRALINKETSVSEGVYGPISKIQVS